MLKNILIIALLLFLTLDKSYSQTKNFYVASYNLENLFDTIDDENKNDSEYSMGGSKSWSEERLSTKLYNLSRVIRWMNDVNSPDILAVQEVEHEALLQRLIDNHFCDKNYKIAYAESKDKRGIDNALIYNSDMFIIRSVVPIEIHLRDNYPTRYILHVKLIDTVIFKTLNIFVNHWPSRRGGMEKSETNRMMASNTLINYINENINADESIIILGDFNDNPNNKSMKNMIDKTENNLINIATNKYLQKEGTYLYRGEYDMMDQILISQNLYDKSKRIYLNKNSFEIIKPKFIIQTKGAYKGSSLPTYGGRKFLNGFSDHFAVGAKFIIKQ